jgi:hypothetical protein
MNKNFKKMRNSQWESHAASKVCLCLTFRAAVQILLKQIVVFNELFVGAVAREWCARLCQEVEHRRINVSRQAGSVRPRLILLREQVGGVVVLSLAIANVGGRSMEEGRDSR